MKAKNMIGAALRPFRPGVDALTSSLLRKPGGITVTSPAFKESDPIPRLFTADGDARFPGVEWTGLPDGTVSVVLLVEDADIPLPVPVTHLIVYGIDPSLGGLEPGAVQAFNRGPNPAGWACGRNFLGAAGWTPPAPPPGHGMHRYAFQVFALDTRPHFAHLPHRGRLLRRIRPHILAQGQLIGTYLRG